MSDFARLMEIAMTSDPPAAQMALGMVEEDEKKDDAPAAPPPARPAPPPPPPPAHPDEKPAAKR